MNIISIIKCIYFYLSTTYDNNNYFITPASTATGILYITKNSRYFISEHLRFRIKPHRTKPDLADEGLKHHIPNPNVSTWGCDPPYHARIAKELFETGARVCKNRLSAVLVACGEID